MATHGQGAWLHRSLDARGRREAPLRGRLAAIFQFADAAPYLRLGAARRSVSGAKSAGRTEDAWRRLSSGRASRDATLPAPPVAGTAFEAAGTAVNARPSNKSATPGGGGEGGSRASLRRSPRGKLSPDLAGQGLDGEREGSMLLDGGAVLSKQSRAAGEAQQTARPVAKVRSQKAIAALPATNPNSDAQQGSRKRRTEAVSEQPAGQTTPSGGKRVKAPQAAAMSPRSFRQVNAL